MEEMMATWHKFRVIRNKMYSLFSIMPALMADRGALPLLRSLLPRTCTLLSFSKHHVQRFQNPRLSLSDSHHIYLSSSRFTLASVNCRRFSYKIFSAADERREYRLTERGKRGLKRRELWEELFEDNVEDDDVDNSVGDGGNGNLDLWKILEEIVDNVWILQAFKSYGYLLPFILLSLFFNTGPKAFLVSLGIAIGPSLLFLAFQKLIGWDKRRKTSMANQFGVAEDEEEEEVGRMRSRVRYKPSSVRNNFDGREFNRGPVGMASKFGGWDDLDGLGTIPEQPTSEPKRKPLRKRKRVRREAPTEPLLLRLLMSLFPFLSSS